MNDNNEFENQNNLKQESNNKPNFDDFSYGKNAKKALIPMFVGLFTMVLLTVGATFAYYNVYTKGSITDSTVTAKTAGQGLITLSGGKVTATMELNATDMSSTNKNKTFYASTTGKTNADTPLTIGTAALSGDTSSYTCDYKITAKAATNNSLITAFSGKTEHDNELVLQLEGTDYNLSLGNHVTAITGATGIVKNGTFTLSGSNSKHFIAKFYLKNTDSDQAFAAGKSAAITITTVISNCRIGAA